MYVCMSKHFLYTYVYNIYIYSEIILKHTQIDCRISKRIRIFGFCEVIKFE